DHRGSADVDLLHAVVEARTAGDGVGERIEVDDDEVEGLDPELVELAPMVRLAGVGEDARVHPRVEGLDPPFETFGEPGQVFDLRHLGTRLGDLGSRRTGRHDLDSGGVESASQVLQPGLVIDADQRSLDRAGSCRRSSLRFVRRSILRTAGGQFAAVAEAAYPRTCRPSMTRSEWARWASRRTSSSLSRALMRSWTVSSVSSSPMGTAYWVMMGPVSTPVSTRWMVPPVSFTPWASASRTPCAPGNDGRSAGWVLMIRLENASTKLGPRMRMNPADTTQSGPSSATARRSCSFQACRSAKSFGRTTKVATSWARARSRTPAVYDSEPTARIATPRVPGANASMTA